MNDRPIPATPPAGGPWRLLVLIRTDPDDPVWTICTVEPFCVRGANLDLAGDVTDFPDVTAWVRATLGLTVLQLVPLPRPLAWRIDGPPR